MYFLKLTSIFVRIDKYICLKWRKNICLNRKFICLNRKFICLNWHINNIWDHLLSKWLSCWAISKAELVIMSKSPNLRASISKAELQGLRKNWNDLNESAILGGIAKEGGVGLLRIEGSGGGNVASLYSRGICSKKCCRVFDAKRKSLDQSVKPQHHIYPD